MSRSEYNALYDKANTKQVKLKLNITTDGDIIARLCFVNNQQGYIKALIRADIKRLEEENRWRAVK